MSTLSASVAWGARLASLLVMAALLPTPGLAQEEGEAPTNPHEMLDALSGGPDGSPTARRGNPLPGTSTSIPTTNPATIHPLPAREGEPASTENTGIDGQCDPVVGFSDCPDRPESAAEAQQPESSDASIEEDEEG